MIDETVEEIREMETHSSSVVAVKAARSLEELLEREFATVDEYERSVRRNSEALRRASPSHASLWTTQQSIVDALEDAEADTVMEAKEVTTSVIDDVVERVESGKQRAAEHAVETLQGADTILTHDYSTTVLEALRLCDEAGSVPDVYVTEARPRFLGRKTARELAAVTGVTPRLIVDSAAGHYLPEVDRVVIGMDCIVDGQLYNRVGTYPLAAVAADQGVPVTVVGSSAKLVERGFQFENEYRSSSEVIREPPTGFTVLNPAYDATPVRLIQSVITDKGIKTEF